MAFVARHHVDLVDLDDALKLDLLGLGEQTRAQARRHGLGIVLMQIEFVGNLAVGEVEPHEIQAQHPDAQRLMMAREDRPAQIIKTAAATLATVALPVLLGVVNAVADDGATGAAWAANAVGPAMLTDHLVAFRVVDEGGEVDQLRRVQDDTDWVGDSPNRINGFAS